MKTLYIVLAAIIVLLILNRTSSGYAPPKYISEGFVGLCPPGQMPASYTTAGGSCVPYYF